MGFWLAVMLARSATCSVACRVPQRVTGLGRVCACELGWLLGRHQSGVVVLPGGDILGGSPAGQREAARRALQAQGVEIIADAMVTRVERASSAQQPEQLVTGAPSTSQPAFAGPSPPSSSPAEPYRKAVHVKLAGGPVQGRRPCLLVSRSAVHHPCAPGPDIACMVACFRRRSFVCAPPREKHNRNPSMLLQGTFASLLLDSHRCEQSATWLRNPGSGWGQDPACPSCTTAAAHTQSSEQAGGPQNWRRPLAQLVEADLVLWTAGSEPVTRAGVSDATPSLPFPANERGALRTDPTLRVLDHPRVFALGDVASASLPASAAASSSSGGALPATAQASACVHVTLLLCQHAHRNTIAGAHRDACGASLCHCACACVPSAHDCTVSAWGGWDGFP